MAARMLWALCVAASLYFLLFHGLGAVGLLSADEPRYASIGRAMALSGDWITPRLDGAPWFEKPPLLYWMIAAGWTLGLRDEWAARLPVACASLAFLWYFRRVLAREFGTAMGNRAAIMLATTVAWLGFGSVAVTDLPLSAAFGAAALGAFPTRDRIAWRSGALLGLAVLAKGLVPLVLAAPVVWFWRKRWRMLLGPAATAAVVAGPWYLACYLANGREFWDEFIVKHHLQRFSSDALAHVQPWWFYLPVFAAGLIPWTPALAGLARRDVWKDQRLRYLGALAGFGLLFFSAAQNKLPGYLLPLVPLAIAMAAARMPDRAAPVCALLASLLPAAAMVLAPALRDGLGAVTLGPGAVLPVAAAGLILAALTWRRRWGVAVPALLVVAGVVYAKRVAYPVLDEEVSARGLWREIAPRRSEVCLDWVDRDVRYGLNYYSVEPLPDCETQARPLRIRRR